MSTRVQAVRWKIARRHLNRRRTHRLRWAMVSAFVMLLLLSGASVAAGMYFVSQLPSVNKFHIHYTFQDARIYDSTGHLLFDMADLSKDRGRRVVVPLQDRYDTGDPCRGGVNRIPVLLQDATIATEDATFYKNPGFDLGSIVRAALDDLKYGHIVSGASTITQQLVRVNILNDERTLNRKAQEVALAYEISKLYSKRKILWFYLNSVPYGNLAYGAQAAAEVYFQEPVCRLDLAQAALIAGLPRAPSDYNPVQHRAAAISRMRTVLTLLWKHGYLQRDSIQLALNEARGWRFSSAIPRMRYPQFVRYVVDQVQHMPKLRSQLYQGIDVYTTIDPRLQNTAQTMVTSQINGLTQQHVTDGALVSMDLRPQHYGWILAMVGSAHYSDRAGQINMAITPRQPGSSMKPFNYVWAFTHGGVGPGTTVIDSPITLPDPNNIQGHGWYSPTNYDRLFHGLVTLRQALANSLNVPAVKVEYYITSPMHVARTAARFGMTSLYRDNPGLDCSVCYAVTLGGLTRGTRLLEETSAYGVFATGGQTVPPVAIWKVVKRSTGRVLYCSEACPRGVRPDPAIARSRQMVLDSAHAYQMTDVLADNNARCTPQVCEFGLDSPLKLSRPAAAKTGTTNSYTDNWTVGYTPQIVTGVWTGNADRSPMLNVIGITGAAPIWHDFMEAAFRILKLPAIWYVPPSNVTSLNQCTVPGSRFARYGLPELYVSPAQPLQPLTPPLCSIPEKGSLPVPCSKYPSTVYLYYFRCPAGTTYTYTNGFGDQNQPGTTYPQNSLTPTVPQTGLPPAPPGSGIVTSPRRSTTVPSNGGLPFVVPATPAPLPP